MFMKVLDARVSYFIIYNIEGQLFSIKKKSRKNLLIPTPDNFV